MINMVRMSNNPQLAINQLLQNNPQARKAMDYIKASGKDPEAAFYALANQMNVNPQEVLDAVNDAMRP